MERTLYFRSDSHTVNTVTAKKLLETNGGSSGSLGSGGLFDPGGFFVSGRSRLSSVTILHENGSEDSLISNGAQYDFYNYPIYSAYDNSTCVCSGSSLVPTDALKVVMLVCAVHYYAGDTYVATDTWVTEQLNSTRLNASTWNFYRYDYLTVAGVVPNPVNETHSVYYGDTYTTYLGNVDYDRASAPLPILLYT